MNQSFDTQLQVVKRALTDVVLPALDGAEKHVVEQLHLSLVVAEFMKARLPFARRYYRSELEAYASLAGSIAELLSAQEAARAEEMQGQVSKANKLLGDPEAEWEDYIVQTRGIRANISWLTENASGQDYEGELDNLILASGVATSLQARIWCLPFGFEISAEALPEANWLMR